MSPDYGMSWWISTTSCPLVIQTHHKVLGSDEVERDEGVWLFRVTTDGTDGRVEFATPDYAWKNLPLTDRMVILEQAKDSSLAAINTLIRSHQLNPKAGTSRNMHNKFVNRLAEIDQDTSRNGGLVVGSGGDILQKSGTILEVEKVILSELPSKEQITVLLALRALTAERYRKASTILSQWDHLVKSSQKTPVVNEP